MRIVQVANLVHERSGGMRTVLDQLAVGYAASGHEVHLVTPAPVAGRTPRHGGSWHRVAGPRLPGGAGYHLALRRRPLRSLLAELRPDAVELSDRWTLAWVGHWAAAHGVRCTLLVHERLDRTLATWLPEPVTAVAPLTADWLDARQRVDAVVAPSRWVRASLPVHAMLPPAHVVPWGVDHAVFGTGAGQPPPGRPGVDRPARLVIVGRLSTEKDPLLAIRAVEELALRGLTSELHVVGDGPLRARLAPTVERLGGRMHGHLGAPAAVAALVASSDVLLAPCGIEAFGLAALEALACGTPVVTVESGAVREVLGRQPVPGAITSASPAAMAVAIQGVLRRADTLRRLAQRRAAEATWDRTVATLLSIHGDEHTTPSPSPTGLAS